MIYPDDYINKIICGDCLDVMQNIPSNSIDMILCDLPYGTTRHKQDKKINLDVLWGIYKRIIKNNGAIVLTCQFPFTAELYYSNKSWFRYDLVWDKVLISGFLNSNRCPLRSHENILVFYRKLPTYNPQFSIGNPLHSKGNSYKNKEIKNQNYGEFSVTDDIRSGSTEKYPKSILQFKKSHPSKSLHRTEKPVPLFEYLIKTYTNEGDLVLDNCLGSGTTAIACLNTNRRCIGIEKEPKYVEISKNRVIEHETNR